MPRKRNSNKPPRSQGPPPGKRRGGFAAKSLAERSSNFSSPSPADNARGHGYSLAEEARNTAYNRRGKRGLDARLRYQPVKFISAGFMDPLKDLEVEQNNLNEVQPTQKGEEGVRHTITVLDDAPGPTENTKEPDVGGKKPSAPPFILDVSGENSLRQNQESTPGASIPDSPYDSDSSDEVILFKGRDLSRQNHSPSGPSQDTSHQHDNNPKDTLELRAIDRELRVVEKSIQKESLTITYERSQQKVQETIIEAEDHIPLSTTAKRGRSRRKQSVSTTSDEEAANIADYIANMQDDADGEDDRDDKRHSIGSHAFHVLRGLGGTDSDAVPGEISSEEHSSDGSTDDEMEEEYKKAHRGFEDERMARVLAKQEELGLGSNNILLFDDADSDYDEDNWQPAPKETPRRNKKGVSKRARIVQKKGQYPSATQVADAFDDLDLMDWHRPSLNNFKKALKTFNASDSDLEEAMNIAWQRDRLKKAEKKKAREELRSQGLLGKNANPDDLRVKYRGGMSIDDLANELESFLTGSQQQLALPPFDKRSRMTVHQLSNKFKIKSQSAGKGSNRYTVLYRSRTTLPFDQVSFDRAFARTRQTWFPRVDVDEEIVNQMRILKKAEPKKTRGGGKHSLTYREGDIVGQHASELSAANKGRTMLEKMGWTRGTGLGSGENKGITVPLTQVVKKTKAGLGDT